MPEIEAIPTRFEKVISNFRELLKSQETREIVAFLSTQFIAFLVFMSLRQIFPLYLQNQTGLDWEQIAIQWTTVVSVYTFGGIITRIPSGFLIEKLGRKVMIVISYILMILSVGGLAFTTSTIALAALWVIIRTSNNIFGLTSRSLLSDIESKYKGFYNSLTSAAGRLGSMIGTIGLGIILDFFQPYIMLVCVVVISVLGLIIFFLLFIKGKGEERHENRREIVKNGTKTKLDLSIFKSKIFIFFVTAFIVIGLMEGLSNPLFGIYGASDLNLSDTLVGTLIGLSNLSFVIIGPIVGIVISQKSEAIDYLFLAAPLIMFTNYLVFYLVEKTVIVFAVFLFVRNIGHALFFPIAMTILTSELPKDNFSFIYSIITTAFFLGNSLTNYLGGIIYERDHILPFFYSMIVSIIAIIVVFIYVMQDKLTKRRKT